MLSYTEFSAQFLRDLDTHTDNKINQWGSMGEMLSTAELLALISEELGEVAAIINEPGKGKTKPNSIERMYTECIEVAHTAMLLAYKAKRFG